MASSRPSEFLVQQIVSDTSGLLTRRGCIPRPYGFKDLDSYTWGLRPSEVTILGGAPAAGKSALALGIAEHQLFPPEGRRPSPVAYFTTDDTGKQLIARLSYSRARVNVKLLRDGLISKSGDEPKRLAVAFEEVAASPLFVDDNAYQTIETVAAQARRLNADSPLGLIVIDCVQMLDPTDATRPHPRDQQVGETARGLKNLAKELAVPVLAVSQLTRTPGRVGQERAPQLVDLRDSGSLEASADTVLLLAPIDESSVACQVAKQRNGPTGELRLTFLRDITRFENYHP